MNKQSIPASDEAWDDRVYGADEDFVGVFDEDETGIDEAACMQLISIRLNKSLIEDFKLIASFNGEIGYQTLMRQILQRFADAERRRIFRELISEKLRQQDKVSTEPPLPSKGKSRQRRAA